VIRHTYRTNLGSVATAGSSVLPGCSSYPELSRSLTLLREPLAGTTVHTSPGTPGHLPAWFPQLERMTRSSGLGAILTLFRLTSEKPQVRTLLRPQFSNT
jgi:hypothetical protein